MIVNTPRKSVPPAWPQHPDNALHLHLGCGMQNHPAYVNIDILDAPHIHCVQYIDDLSNFESDSADSIYASHCLEHFGHHRTLDVLIEWVRVLKPGGILRLSVPDFDKIIALYQTSGKLGDNVVQSLMGGQDEPYNVHYAVFNRQHLSTLMIEAGLEDIQEWTPQADPLTQLSDWASVYFVVNGQQMPISLNLCGAKRNVG